MRNSPYHFTTRAPLAAEAAPRVFPQIKSLPQSVSYSLHHHSTHLQNAADATVAAVLKANFSPAAFAVLEEFRKDFDKAYGDVGTPLLRALNHLSEPDTQKVLCKTLRRLLRTA